MGKTKILRVIAQFYNFFSKKEKSPKYAHNQIVRKKVDNEAIRTRIKTQGWNLLEIPIQKKDPNSNHRTISRWKIVASKGERSIEVGGETINEALKNIGVCLGVIAKEN